MSYVLPPNNNIRILCDQNNVDAQRLAYETDLKLQLADFDNTPGGGGPVRGWGTGRRRR